MEAQAQMVDTSRLVPSTVSVRKKLDDIDGLAGSIVSVGRVLQPLLGRAGKGDAIELIFGHRRRLAAIKASLAQVPVIVVEADDDQVRRMQAAENLQRQNPTPLEEAEYFGELEDAGLPPAEIAASVGRQLPYVLQRRRLLALSPRCRRELAEGRITLGVAEYLARMLPTHGDQDAACDSLVDQFFRDGDRANLDAAKKEISHHIRPLDRAPFATALKDADLVKKAGSCDACPKRTGTQRDLFGADAKDDRCLDQDCYEKKVEAFNSRLKLQVTKAGGEVLGKVTANRILDADGNVKAGSGFVDPSEKANGKDTWFALLQQPGVTKKVATGVVFDEHERGHLVLREEDARKALERAGVALPAPKKNPAAAKAAKKATAKKKTSSDDWKAKYEKEEAARKIRQAQAQVLEGAAMEILDQVLVHVEKKGMSEPILRVLVQRVTERSDISDQWVLKEHSKDRRERVQRAKADKIGNAKELLVALVDAVFYEATSVNSFSAKDVAIGDDLVVVAKAAGVEWKAIEKRHVDAAAAAKVEADKKAAAAAEKAGKKPASKKGK